MDDRVKLIGRETAIAARRNNWPQSKAKYEFDKAVATLRTELFKRDNCHPFKTQTASFIQLPVWIATSLALRNMSLGLPQGHIESEVIKQQLSFEGVGWIPNLTDVDHSLILPVTLVLTNLFLTEVLPMVRPRVLNVSQKIVTYTYRVFCLVIVPMAAFAPADVVLYWTVSNAISLAQNMLLLTPRFRRICGIPKTESELQHPFRDLATNLKKKFTVRKLVTKSK